MIRSILSLTLLVFASSCGIKRVPGDVLSQLPYEAKIELLEAENDLALAVDQLDEAKSEIGRARDQIRRAKDRLDDAEDEVGAAKDALTEEVAKLAVTEAELRVKWLRAHQDLNVENEELAELNLTCAMARYEVARLAAARKAKLAGSERLEPETFDRQVKECEEDYAKRREERQASNAEAEKVRTEWDQARASLAKKTFDARASPYVE
jgi:hypothetical protein